MNDVLETAKAAAEAGAKVLRQHFGRGLLARSKTHQPDKTYDLVTDADLASEKVIAEVIRQNHPDHILLAEEGYATADTDAEHLWIVDPLDGTTNFAHDIPHFAVSVAYYHRGVAEVGVIVNPARDDWYICGRGKGAFHNDQPVAITQADRLRDVLIGVGFYYDRGRMMEATLNAIRDLFLRDIRGIRRFGTASLDLCQVALGMFGAFFEFELSPWDFAAGRLFVEEAGGLVTTCQGLQLPLQKCSLLAGNGPVHAAVLEVVKPHFEGL